MYIYAAWFSIVNHKGIIWLIENRRGWQNYVNRLISQAIILGSNAGYMRDEMRDNLYFIVKNPWSWNEYLWLVFRCAWRKKDTYGTTYFFLEIIHEVKVRMKNSKIHIFTSILSCSMCIWMLEGKLIAHILLCHIPFAHS